MTPTDPKKPGGDDSADRASERRGPRPGGHGSYKIGGEPATGHTWHEAAPPRRRRPTTCIRPRTATRRRPRSTTTA